MIASLGSSRLLVFRKDTQTDRVRNRRSLQARAFSAGRLPYDPAQSALLDQDLPPQHRQAGPYLP